MVLPFSFPFTIFGKKGTTNYKSYCKMYFHILCMASWLKSEFACGAECGIPPLPCSQGLSLELRSPCCVRAAALVTSLGALCLLWPDHCYPPSVTRAACRVLERLRAMKRSLCLKNRLDTASLWWWGWSFVIFPANIYVCEDNLPAHHCMFLVLLVPFHIQDKAG